jgi:hypothetical protein
MMFNCIFQAFRTNSKDILQTLYIIYIEQKIRRRAKKESSPSVVGIVNEVVAASVLFKEVLKLF